MSEENEELSLKLRGPMCSGYNGRRSNRRKFSPDYGKQIKKILKPLTREDSAFRYSNQGGVNNL